MILFEIDIKQGRDKFLKIFFSILILISPRLNLVLQSRVKSRIYNGIRIPQGGENLLQLGTQNLRELERVGLMGLATNWYRFVVQRILKWLS